MLTRVQELRTLAIFSRFMAACLSPGFPASKALSASSAHLPPSHTARPLRDEGILGVPPNGVNSGRQVGRRGLVPTSVNPNFEHVTTLATTTPGSQLQFLRAGISLEWMGRHPGPDSGRAHRIF